MGSSNKYLNSGLDEQQPQATVRWMILALIIVVVMAYFTMFLQAYGGNGREFTPVQLVLLTVLGVLYTFLVIYPTWITRYFSAALGPWVYFPVIYVIALAIFLLADLQGEFWLLILPPLGTAAEYGLKWLIGASLLALTLMPLVIFLEVGQWQFGLLFTLVPAVFFVSAFSLVSVRERSYRERIEILALDLRDANQRLSDYASKVEELTVMRERNRMARDVHDTLGHYLTVVNVQIGAAKAILKRDPDKAAVSLDNAQRMTQDGLRDIRQSVAFLREGGDNRPLTETVPQLAAQSEAGGLTTTTRFIGELPEHISPKITQTIFRTIQEGLTNIRKHAQATAAEVTIDGSDPEKIAVTIQDDGQGADAAVDGFGLMGMRERVQQAGGTFNIDTKPGHGFRIHVDLPITLKVEE